MTHLVELLTAANPEDQGVERVTVWAGRQTLDQLPPKRWLDLKTDPALQGGLAGRAYWQLRRLQAEASRSCDVLFVPGGSYNSSFRPFVTMFRNMLPFDRRERQRFGYSAVRLRLRLLQQVQRSTFRRAAGVILLTEHARTVLARDIDRYRLRVTVIPHGVNPALRRDPRPQQPLSAYSTARPFRLLYVSHVAPYKHQWQVVKAVAELRREGLPLDITFVGGGSGPSCRQLQASLAELDSQSAFAHYEGPLGRSATGALYHAVDGFVFASTCENLPNILLEAMAAGLPIVSSNRRPMPDVLGDQGLYFDPDSVASIVAALRVLATDLQGRSRNSRAAYQRALNYSWVRCAEETFRFIRSVPIMRSEEAESAVPAVDRYQPGPSVALR